MSIQQNGRLAPSMSSSFLNAAANRNMFVDNRHRSGAGGRHYGAQTILTTVTQQPGVGRRSQSDSIYVFLTKILREFNPSRRGGKQLALRLTAALGWFWFGSR